MEESNTARRGSGVHDATYDSSSDASLKGDFKVSVTPTLKTNPVQ
jgi:hypothetical protein